MGKDNFSEVVGFYKGLVVLLGSVSYKSDTFDFLSE